MIQQPEQFAPVAVINRSGVDESVHFGAVVCLDRDGSTMHSIGDSSVAIYPRSSLKPLQAVAMVEAGLRLAPEQLALVCASHNGEAIHLETVAQILKSAGLSESALRNTAGQSLDPASAATAVQQQRAPSPLQMNCSGKHAGMLATCVVNGWSTDDYLHSDHPLQASITAVITRLTQKALAAIGVDGCGAPAHVVGLIDLALAVRAIAIGDIQESGTQVYNAMTRHPYMVGGNARDVTAIMQGVSGLVAKDGAEGVYVAAMPDGRAVALKIADGSERSRCTVMLAALAMLGIDTSKLQAELQEYSFGHGHPVGEVRAIGFMK